MDKKLFPKISKKITGFLTDESGKITKKDMIGLSAMSILLLGIENVKAGCEVISLHQSGMLNGHYNTSGPSLYIQSSADNSCDLGNSGHGNRSCELPSARVSTIINGHYNASPIISGGGEVGHCSHGNHGNHGNSHCSGCTRCSNR